jgi:hypothetical protein
VVVAWAACLIGFALGALGCMIFVAAAAPQNRPAAPAGRARPIQHGGPQDARDWARRVEAASAHALAVVRQLAGGVDRQAARAVAADLDDAAERFDSLRAVAPRVALRTALLDQLDVASRGARAEAARLRDVTPVGNNRRAFLDALRSLHTSGAQLAAGARRPKPVAVEAVPRHVKVG